MARRSTAREPPESGSALLARPGRYSKVLKSSCELSFICFCPCALISCRTRPCSIVPVLRVLLLLVQIRKYLWYIIIIASLSRGRFASARAPAWCAARVLEASACRAGRRLAPRLQRCENNRHFLLIFVGQVACEGSSFLRLYHRYMYDRGSSRSPVRHREPGVARPAPLLCTRVGPIAINSIYRRAPTIFAPHCAIGAARTMPHVCCPSSQLSQTQTKKRKTAKKKNPFRTTVLII